jgi:hypothetical protein
MKARASAGRRPRQLGFRDDIEPAWIEEHLLACPAPKKATGASI